MVSALQYIEDSGPIETVPVLRMNIMYRGSSQCMKSDQPAAFPSMCVHVCMHMQYVQIMCTKNQSMLKY